MSYYRIVFSVCINILKNRVANKVKYWVINIILRIFEHISFKIFYHHVWLNLVMFYKNAMRFYHVYVIIFKIRSFITTQIEREEYLPPQLSRFDPSTTYYSSSLPGKNTEHFHVTQCPRVRNNKPSHRLVF